MAREYAMCSSDLQSLVWLLTAPHVCQTSLEEGMTLSWRLMAGHTATDDDENGAGQLPAKEH